MHVINDLMKLLTHLYAPLFYGIYPLSLQMFLDLCLLIDVERLKQGVDVLAYMVKFPNEILNLLRGGWISLFLLFMLF